VLLAEAVYIGASANSLVIKEIASDLGLFLSKLERKLRRALRELYVL
jgi:hypothetical protein